MTRRPDLCSTSPRSPQHHGGGHHLRKAGNTGHAIAKGTKAPERPAGDNDIAVRNLTLAGDDDSAAQLPKLRAAIGMVMRNDLLSPDEILVRLDGQGWAPSASQPLSYVKYTMTDNPQHFECVRGKFRVRAPKVPPPTPQEKSALIAVGATAIPGQCTPTTQPARAGEHWRSMFIGLIQAIGAPKVFHQELIWGLQHRIWVHLTDSLGNKFQTLESFCKAPPPFGLGTELDRVVHVLAHVVGPREADLLIYAPARQGARNRLPANAGGKSTRQTERLRAVQERAPEAVRHLYTTGILPLAAAARFGLAKPTTAQIAQIERASAKAADLVRRLRESTSDADRKAAQREARALLPARPSRRGEASRLMEQCRALPAHEREVFIRLFEAWLRNLEAGRSHLDR